MAWRVTPLPNGDGEVDVFVRRYSGQVKYCLEQILKNRAEAPLSGRLSFEVRAPDGKVEELIRLGDTTDEPDLANCAIAKIKRWPFPAREENFLIVFDVRYDPPVSPAATAPSGPRPAPSAPVATP